MAHQAQQNYVAELKNQRPEFFSNKKVLEVGSLNINGSIRQFFEDCDYLGVDVGPGPGVDLVCGGQELTEPDETFDVTASAECFEHNPYWKETLINMIRMTKSEGLVFFTCATTGRPEHGTTRSDIGSSPLTVAKGWEYYQNLTELDIRQAIDVDQYFNQCKFIVEPDSCDLYFWGIKK